MNARVQNDINAYHQLDDENLHTTWECYKYFLRRCPMQGIQQET